MTTPDPKTIVIPGPRIRLSENDRLRTLLFDEINAGHTNLVLDFHDVEFVDSSFLGLLIIVLKRATSAGGDLKLCCLRKPLQDIFGLMRLDRLFDTYGTEEEARASFT